MSGDGIRHILSTITESIQRQLLGDVPHVEQVCGVLLTTARIITLALESATYFARTGSSLVSTPRKSLPSPKVSSSSCWTLPFPVNAFAHSEVRAVAALIEDLGLPHPSVPLLISFVTEAVNPVFAANYIHDRLSSGEARTVVDDWVYIVGCITENGSPPPSPDASARSAISRRDGGKCCITGKPGTFSDPLMVVPILPCPSGWVTDQGRIVTMLGAFFGEGYRDWWLSVAQYAKQLPPYRNHWLVRKSAARAFSKGLIRLDRLQPSMFEGRYALLGDHSRAGIEKVDPRFVGTHARLCRSVQYIELAKEIASEILSESSQPSGRRPTQHIGPYGRKCAFSLSQLFPTRIFLSIWLLFPSRLRIAAYDLLLKLANHCRLDCTFDFPACLRHVETSSKRCS
ncbi:hypothetical protein NUW54_g12309 [Trametes sanguinea]|uniref:Uncharacterized protein n=1 Tax=Trametes sanguinea TaxID=158606 RepID=A0ACC1MZS0_9APHY|nr:hypothetical protein NUW54_g12309 [Trametes sanguinea]